jgi:DNA-directed RNA polymerase specialized sigma24 family protein
MKFIDELSYQEISKIVNKSEVSLRKTLSRMVGRLNKGESL